MKIDVTPEIRTRAKAPHDLYVLNMFLFNLPAVAGILAYTIGHHWVLAWVIGGALSISLGFVAFFHWRAAKAETRDPWFVMVHWKQAANRTRLLLIGYAAAAVIIGVGVLIASGTKDHNMGTILITVFTRIGVVPALVMVLVTAILEGQAMHLTNNGIAPGDLAKRYPPPADVSVLDGVDEGG